MRGLRSPHEIEHGRLLLLLVGFAVVLLASISATMASSVSPLSLVDGVRRDLGAVRVQLERIGPIPHQLPRQSVAFNTDVGDGGPAFRHRSMATILRSANRRLENLASGYRNAGDDYRSEVAQNAQQSLRELEKLVQYLGSATDDDSLMWSRKRVEAEALLDQMRQSLVILLPDPSDLQVSELR
jgi:hypothetical protein